MRLSTFIIRIDPKLGDAIAGSLAVLLGLWVRFWAIPRYVSEEVIRGVPSGLVPNALSFILVALGVVLAVRSVWQLRHAEPHRKKMTINLLSFVVLLAALVYAIFLDQVGFLFGTPLLMFLVFKLLGGEKWRQGVILSVVVTGVLWAVFRICLHIKIPVGPLEWWLG